MNANLHRQLITEHRTARWESPEAAVSIRREHGVYVVRFHDRIYHKRTRTAYKTLQGAQIAAEMMRKFYL